MSKGAGLFPLFSLFEKNLKKRLTFQKYKYILVSKNRTNEPATEGRRQKEESMKRTYDITTNGNMIGGRQGWAYICNSGEVKVLEADFDKEQGYNDYHTYGKAKLVNQKGLTKVAKLARDTSEYAPKWSFGGSGTFITNNFGYSDAMELVANAQLVTIKEGDIVAIAKHTHEAVALELFKLSKVDIHCTTVARLTPLTEEEMIEVGRSATRWLER